MTPTVTKSKSGRLSTRDYGVTSKLKVKELPITTSGRKVHE